MCLKCALVPGITLTTVSVINRVYTHTGEKLSHLLLPLRWPGVQSEGAIRTKGMHVIIHLISNYTVQFQVM